MELTTVADDLAVLHDGLRVIRVDGLAPDQAHEVDGVELRTLPRPPGELLGRIATVNDVHFGETECGRIDDHPIGPIQRAEPGEPPYPETMNRGAVAEIAAIDPAAVIVKGDLTNDGGDDEFAAFEQCYADAFGARLHVVRGNHDAYRGQQRYAGDQWIEVPGLAVALLDTVRPRETTGWLHPEQLAWLDERAARADRPVLVMGHHQQFVGDGSPERHDGYFGIHPDPSAALTVVLRRRPRILGYLAGHTHRHRVRWLPDGIPTVEVGCVKDFPGTWAEYRIYEGGVMQVAHRISSPDALRWSERCRHLYADFGIDYESYALGTLEERCFTFPTR